MPRYEHVAVRSQPKSIGKTSGGIRVTRSGGQEARVTTGFSISDVHRVLQDLGDEGFELVAVEVHEEPAHQTVYWLKRAAD